MMFKVSLIISPHAIEELSELSLPLKSLLVRTKLSITLSMYFLLSTAHSLYAGTDNTNLLSDVRTVVLSDDMLHGLDSNVRVDIF